MHEELAKLKEWGLIAVAITAILALLKFLFRPLVKEALKGLFEEENRKQAQFRRLILKALREQGTSIHEANGAIEDIYALLDDALQLRKRLGYERRSISLPNLELEVANNDL
jgi:hypothetical protein